MEILTLKLTDMANGGSALGRDEGGRVIFVPFAIPGETVRVEIVDDKERFAHARVLEVIAPAPERIEPRCPHFGVCGGCHWQHMNYEAQLIYKREVVRDQLKRIGGLENIDVRPTVANREPWQYGTDVNFSATVDGKLGFWSPFLRRVLPIEVCYIIRPALLELYQDIDFSFAGLQSLSLRLGDDDAMLVALETEDLEPPELATDFPISAALILPDGTAANLIGDNFVVKTVKGRDFRVTAGSFFYPSPPAATAIVDTVLELAALRGTEVVLEAYCGVGMLTAFLAERAAEVVAIEVAPDAVADAAFNLEETENVSVYESLVEDVLPTLALVPDVMVVDPAAAGLSREVVEAIINVTPPRLIYISSDAATLARDARQLNQQGFRLMTVQPIDMMPQTAHVHTVSLWVFAASD